MSKIKKYLILLILLVSNTAEASNQLHTKTYNLKTKETRNYEIYPDQEAKLYLEKTSFTCFVFFTSSYKVLLRCSTDKNFDVFTMSQINCRPGQKLFKQISDKTSEYEITATCPN